MKNASIVESQTETGEGGIDNDRMNRIVSLSGHSRLCVRSV